MKVPEHIQQAIQAYYAERATDEDITALEAWLREDEANVRVFAEHGMLEWHLLCETEKADAAAVLTSLRDAEEQAEPDFSLLSSLSFETAPTDQAKERSITLREMVSLAGYAVRISLRTKAAAYGSIAALLLIAGVLAIALIGFGDKPGISELSDNTPIQSPDDRATVTPIVATLTATQDAIWAEGAAALGSPLRASQTLTLTAGFAEITTISGAVAILEAPCTIELVDHPNSLRLHDGKLVGRCETRLSQGFTVLTERARIVDLGTVFGVEITQGTTRTTVFEGEVTVAAAGLEHSDAKPVYLSQGQSAQVDHLGRVERFTPAPQSRFVRQWKDVAQPPQVTGQIEYRPALPASLAPGASESNEIQLYPEATGVRLDSDFRATLTEPGKHESFSAEDAQPIGTASVDAYLVHYDMKNVVGNPGPIKPSHATIRFDRPILGVVANGESLFASDPLFAPVGVDYGPSDDPKTTLGRGLEPKGLSSPDIVEISEDRRTLTLELYSKMAIDQLRILVQSPEPTVQ